MREEKKPGETLWIFLRSVLTGLVACLGILVLWDLVFLFSDLGQEWMSPAATASMGAGCLFSGYLTGRRIKKRGLIFGLAGGAALVAILWVLAHFTSGLGESSEMSLIKGGICVLLGGAGGMIGVNR